MKRIPITINTTILAKHQLEGFPIMIEHLRTYETELKGYKFESFTNENGKRLEHEVSRLIYPHKGDEYFVRIPKTSAKLTKIYMNFKPIKI